MSTQLEAALRAYQRSLPEGTIETLRIDHADYLGVPIVNVDLFTPAGYYSGIGYGADETQALVGAYGELAEDCHLQLHFPQLEQVAGSYHEMVQRYGDAAVLDPLTLVLEAGSAYDPDLTLRWIQIDHLGGGVRVWCPAEFVGSGDWELPDYPHKLVTAISNGSGAGDTEDRAVLHALLEYLQRDGNADSFRALDRGRVIDPATVSEAVRQLLDRLAERGLHITLKLARVTCGCASVYAVGDDRTDDRFGLGATACGEAADPSIDRALEKAILECASSHSRKRFNNLPLDQARKFAPAGYFQRIRDAIDLAEEEQRALESMVDFVQSDKAAIRDRLAGSVFSHHETVDARSLPNFADPSIVGRLAYVRAEMAKEGMEEVYLVSSSTTGGNCHAVQLIVPLMEMELGSYHRIGYRGVKRLLEDDPFHLLSHVSEPGTALIHLTEAQNRECGGPCYLHTARLDAIVDPLYVLYREPTAHAAPIAIEEGYFSAP